MVPLMELRATPSILDEAEATTGKAVEMLRAVEKLN